MTEFWKQSWQKGTGGFTILLFPLNVSDLLIIKRTNLDLPCQPKNKWNLYLPYSSKMSQVKLTMASPVMFKGSVVEGLFQITHAFPHPTDIKSLINHSHCWICWCFRYAALKEMATHSSVLAWRIPGMGEPRGLPSTGSQSWTQLKRLSSSTEKIP